MAMRARVELRGSLTHTTDGRTFKKGQPQYLTNPAEVKYYKDQGGFLVTILEDTKEKAAPPAPKAPPAPASEPGGQWTKSALMMKNKAQLVAIGSEEFGLTLDPESKKEPLVDAILKAQSDAAEGDADDEGGSDEE